MIFLFLILFFVIYFIFFFFEIKQNKKKEQFKIPDPSKIPFFTIQTLRNDEIVSQNPSQKSPFESIISDKENKLPFWIQFDRKKLNLFGFFSFSNLKH